MNQAFSLSQAFDVAGVPLADREYVTALAAGRRTAYSLPLPAEPIGSPVDFYNESYAKQAEASLGALNEASVLDFEFALAVAKLYWLARYRVLHVPESSEAMKAVTGLVEELLNRENVADLGFTNDPHNSGGGLGSAVAVVDGRTTLVGVSSLTGLNSVVESMQPAFQAVWGAPSQGA
jgi:hypothetical protein